MSQIITPKPYLAIIRTGIIVILIIVSSFLFLSKYIEIETLLFANIAVIALGAIYCVMAYLIKKFERINLSETTLTYTRGILSKKEYVFPYSKITEASFHQSLFQRILGCGTVKIDTPGGIEMALSVSEVAKTDARKILDMVHKNDK